MHTILEVCT